MAYDGIFIKKQIDEIKPFILNEHISRITQNSHKGIDLHFRKSKTNLIFSLSADPNFPHIKLISGDTDNFDTPPAFCMLMRKYLNGGTIKNIIQTNPKNEKDTDLTLERVIRIEIENIDEKGDICIFYLFIEIMGKYSNIILTNNNLIILDILNKDLNNDNSRLKQKNTYTLKTVCEKDEILITSYDRFFNTIKNYETLVSLNNEKFDISNAITKNYAGLSKNFINYIIKLSENKDNAKPYYNIYTTLIDIIHRILNDNNYIAPHIIYKNNKTSDLNIIKFDTYDESIIKHFNNINSCVDTFIKEKFSNINDSTEKQNVIDIIKNLYLKFDKKLSIYKSDLDKSKDYEKYKLYGELVSAFGYDNNNIDGNFLICKNYYDNDNIINIPLDTSLSIAENANKYYDKYNKLKRTKEKANELITDINNKIEHLNSISSSINLSNDKNDIFLIKDEILNYFSESNKLQSLKKHKENIRTRKQTTKNKLNYNIHHYKASNGIDIYIGKNNLQNEYLTFTLASSNDTWLHIKDATGSHVIIKKPYTELDDKTIIEAASLAAYFSDKRNETKATVDYTLKKELKKVKGKAPGFCIYHKNYSINVKPEVIIKEI